MRFLRWLFGTAKPALPAPHHSTVRPAFGKVYTIFTEGSKWTSN